MSGWLSGFGFGRRKLKSESDRDPVVLVPGIGGSILQTRKKYFGFIPIKFRVWVRILFSQFFFKEELYSIYNPATGYTESLNDNTVISVPDDDSGLYAISILDPFWLARWKVPQVHYYYNLIEHLLGWGYKKGTTLFGHGYDFRQSNRMESSMVAFKEKLKKASESSGGRKVTVISHSMGGLLVKCFMSLHPREFSQYVGKWICIASPFQGSPGYINDTLLTGMKFVEGFESKFFISKWTFHQLLVECPSIYEMMTNPEFKWKNQPEIQVWEKNHGDSKNAATLKSYDPYQSVSLLFDALKNNTVDASGNDIPLPFNCDIHEWANKTREILNDAKVPDEVTFYNIYGISVQTPYDVQYGTESSPIDNLSEICHTKPQYIYADGDGTIPYESAKADGLEAKERVGVPNATHLGLLSDPTTIQYVKTWLGIDPTVEDKSLKTSKVVNPMVNIVYA